MDRFGTLLYQPLPNGQDNGNSSFLCNAINAHWSNYLANKSTDMLANFCEISPLIPNFFIGI